MAPTLANGKICHVDSVAATIDAVIGHGGELVQPIGVDAPEITAWFRDPAGKRDRPLPATQPIG